MKSEFKAEIRINYFGFKPIKKKILGEMDF